MVEFARKKFETQEKISTKMENGENNKQISQGIKLSAKFDREKYGRYIRNDSEDLPSRNKLTHKGKVKNLMELDKSKINRKMQNTICEGLKSEKLKINGTEEAELLPKQIKKSITYDMT